MAEKIAVDTDEVKRVFLLMEKVNEFFHQPENFEDVGEFANSNYKEIREVYYEIIWNWLPEDLKREF